MNTVCFAWTSMMVMRCAPYPHGCRALSFACTLLSTISYAVRLRVCACVQDPYEGGRHLYAGQLVEIPGFYGFEDDKEYVFVLKFVTMNQRRVVGAQHFPACACCVVPKREQCAKYQPLQAVAVVAAVNMKDYSDAFIFVVHAKLLVPVFLKGWMTQAAPTPAVAKVAGSLLKDALACSLEGIDQAIGACGTKKENGVKIIVDGMGGIVSKTVVLATEFSILGDDATALAKLQLAGIVKGEAISTMQGAHCACFWHL